ncbi:MAG: efflux RND transporter periplasmic adaptor subunit [Chthoniobacterales bacterium]
MKNELDQTLMVDPMEKKIVNGAEAEKNFDAESRAADRRRPRRAIFILFVAGACLAALAVVGIRSRSATTSNLQKVAEQAAQMTVSLTHPARAPATVTLDLPGQTQAYIQAPVFAQTSGYLKRWNFDIGSKVKEGDVLAEIDTPEVDQQLAQAQATLKQAQAALWLSQATYNRDRDLLKGRVIAQQDFDNQAGDLRVKQATVNADEASVGRLEALEAFKLVRAPFDGIVTARNTDIGALINSGSGNALFMVARVSPLRVYVSVPEAMAAYVKEGAKADLTFNTFPGRKFPADVVHTAGAIDPSTHTLLTELQIPNETGELFPGAYAQVHLHTDGNAQALLVPANVLLFRSEGTAVGVVSPEGKVEIRKIAVGRDLGTKLEVTEGLSITDRVIENPSDGLADGMQVRVAGSENRPVVAATEARRPATKD